VETGVPVGVVAIIIVALAGVAVFLGWVASRGKPPNLYLCRRCDAEFRRQAYKPFPGACPSCGARDWPV